MYMHMYVIYTVYVMLKTKIWLPRKCLVTEEHLMHLKFTEAQYIVTFSLF